MTTDSYFEAIDDHRYKPTRHAGGAWDPDEQHFSPLGGLVVHALERHRAARPDDTLVLSRISYDILGRLALDECHVEVETIRPGRTIELLEAVVRIEDRPVVRARAWYLAAHDTTAVAAAPTTGSRRRSPSGPGGCPTPGPAATSPPSTYAPSHRPDLVVRPPGSRRLSTWS